MASPNSLFSDPDFVAEDLSFEFDLFLKNREFILFKQDIREDSVYVASAHFEKSPHLEINFWNSERVDDRIAHTLCQHEK